MPRLNENGLLEIDWSKYPTIPWYMHEGVLDYINFGVPAGGFLQAVILNDLTGAMSRADSANLKAIVDYARLMMWDFPLNARKSIDAYRKWIGSGGLNGQREAQSV